MRKKMDIRMETRQIPVPKPNQMLIRIHTVSICGTDVHFWKEGSIGPYVVRSPLVLGHESSGTVVELGSDVKGFKLGDRVTLEPGVPCRTCYFCKGGRYNLCANLKFFASPPDDGTLAEYVAHDADFCFKLPDSISWEEGSLIEPLSNAVYSCRRANVSIGDKVLVCGAGPIGLMNMLTSKAMGASKVIVTDIAEERLKFAKELNADETLNVAKMSAADAAAEICRKLGGQADICLECVGVAHTTETAILAAKCRGVIVMVGLAEERADIPIMEVTFKELDLCGIIRYVNCYPPAIDLVESGKVNLKNLKTAHYKLSQTPEAFERSLKGDVTKVFVHCQND